MKKQLSDFFILPFTFYVPNVEDANNAGPERSLPLNRKSGKSYLPGYLK